jgi:hypothetical protein
MPAKYLTQSFDPILIISQIILLFSINNILLIFFTILFNQFFGLKLHIDQILSSDNYDLSSNYGYASLFANFFTNFFMMIAYIKVVGKANKILDYVLTNFFLHLIINTLSSHFPFSPMWWMINGILVTIVTLISEYISLRLDQREIKLDFKIENKNKI